MGKSYRRPHLAGGDKNSIVKNPSTAVVLGDSFSTLGMYENGTTYRLASNRSWMWHMQMRLGPRLRILNIAATAGDKISQAAPRMDGEVLPFNPGFLFVLIGINTTHAFTSTTEYQPAFAQLRDEIIEKAIDNGIIPVVFTIPPSDNLNTTTKVDGWHYMNNHIIEYCHNNQNVILVPIHHLYADPAVEAAPLYDSGAVSTSYAYDGVHPNVWGAELIGKAAADAVAPFLQARRYAGSVTGDQFNAATSSGQQWDTTLTAGTLSGTPLPTGSAPTGWTFQGTCTNTTGTTIAGAMVASTDGDSDWFQSSITGSGMAGQTNCSAQLSGTLLTLSGSEFAVGDYVEASVEIDVDAGYTELLSIETVIRFNGAANPDAYYYFPRALNTQQKMQRAEEIAGVVMPIVKIPTGTTSIGLIIIFKHQGSVAAASSVVRLRNPAIRKVTTPVIAPTNTIN